MSLEWVYSQTSKCCHIHTPMLCILAMAQAHTPARKAVCFASQHRPAVHREHSRARETPGSSQSCHTGLLMLSVVQASKHTARHHCNAASAAGTAGGSGAAAAAAGEVGLAWAGDTGNGGRCAAAAASVPPASPAGASPAASTLLPGRLQCAAAAASAAGRITAAATAACTCVAAATACECGVLGWELLLLRPPSATSPAGALMLCRRWAGAQPLQVSWWFHQPLAQLVPNCTSILRKAATSSGSRTVKAAAVGLAFVLTRMPTPLLGPCSALNASSSVLSSPARRGEVR